MGNMQFLRVFRKEQTSESLELHSRSEYQKTAESKKRHLERQRQLQGSVLVPVLWKTAEYASGQRGKFSKFQAGLRKHYSTIDQVFILHTLIQKHISQEGGILYSSFVVLRRALDNANRTLLIRKLITIRMSRKIVGMLKAILQDTTFRVKIESNKISTAFQNNNGVKQGFQLSPVLFNLNINDNEEMLTIGHHAPNLKRVDIPILLWADDLVLLSQRFGKPTSQR